MFRTLGGKTVLILGEGGTCHFMQKFSLRSHDHDPFPANTNFSNISGSQRSACQLNGQLIPVRDGYTQTSLGNVVQMPVSLPARAVHIPQPYTPMRLQDLLDLVPNATGEVEFVEGGTWMNHNLREAPRNIPAGPLLCVTLQEGVDLGPAHHRSRSTAVSCTGLPEVTLRGSELLATTVDPGTPTGQWCEVLVTNFDTGTHGKYIARADTSVALSALPAVGERLGVEAGGFTTSLTALGRTRSRYGAVRVRLLRVAFPQGLDAETGAPVFVYKDLPVEVQRAVGQTDPIVAVLMEAEVPTIGLNLLGAWGLAVDPHAGLIPSPYRKSG